MRINNSNLDWLKGPKQEREKLLISLFYLCISFRDYFVVNHLRVNPRYYALYREFPPMVK